VRPVTRRASARHRAPRARRTAATQTAAACRI